MKLYKFRSLLDCTSFERVAEILETGKFWCSPLWEQNDPMEGVYIDQRKSYRGEPPPDLFPEKNRRQICSFSRAKALKNPLMWGYYAGGFKGIAIEIDTQDDKGFEHVNYVEELPKIQDDKDSIEKILTRKLVAWKMEEEYRYITKTSSGPKKLGKITAVYFGNPYGSVLNQEQVVEASKAIQEYGKRIERLQDIAKKMKYKVLTAQATGDGKVSLNRLRRCAVPKPTPRSG